MKQPEIIAETCSKSDKKERLIIASEVKTAVANYECVNKAFGYYETTPIEILTSIKRSIIIRLKEYPKTNSAFIYTYVKVEIDCKKRILEVWHFNQNGAKDDLISRVTIQ